MLPSYQESIRRALPKLARGRPQDRGGTAEKEYQFGLRL